MNINKKSIQTNISSQFQDDFDNVGKTTVMQFTQTTFTNPQIQLSSAYLVCLLGSSKLMGNFWTIQNNKKINIGRSRNCDIYIQHASVSKKHLQIWINKENQVFVTDFKSTNGTIIDDQVIESNKEIKIKDNSIIKIGNMTFKFLERRNPEVVSIKDNFKKVFYDSLTDIGNKLMLEKRGEELFLNSIYNNTTLSLIIFDIDFFKKVNDTYGHLAGDFVLKEVVQLVKSCFRSDDLFVRCGGEEFCIMMDSSLDKTLQIMETSRKKVEDYIFEYKKFKIKLTLSAGIAPRIKTDKIWKDTYDRADDLLYKSKNTGRNKITIYEK